MELCLQSPPGFGLRGLRATLACANRSAPTVLMSAAIRTKKRRSGDALQKRQHTGSCVSIVMPVRDAAGTLPAVMESIVGQTLSRWELIAVDDGSTDETATLLDRYAREDRRIRVVRQPRMGIASALRMGCEKACGEFVARMDADDQMAPERLERQVEFLRKHPGIGVASCRIAYGGDCREQAGYAAHVEWINSLADEEAIALRRFVESPVAHPSVMFRRELLNAHGSYREGDFPEDYELWLRWLDAGVRFGKVTSELLVWNDRAERLSRTDDRYRPEAFYRIKCVYLARWLRREIAAERPVWLWGAGRITRKRFQWLEREGIRIAGYIDVDPSKAGRLSDGRRVILPEELEQAREAFVIAGVGSRGARELIGAYLAQHHGGEGKDFIFAA